MRRDHRGIHRATGILAATAALALAACTGGSPEPSPSGSPAPLEIVASIDVYGDLAQQLGGDRVHVTSIIDKPSVDPHTYEADARDQLAISKADIIIENGGGYDDFMDTLLSASGNTDAVLFRAVNLSRRSGDSDNEHVWYDLPSVRNLVDGLVDALIQIDRAGADDYRANASRLDRALTAVQKRADRVASEHSGATVLATEPAALYLMDALGLKNVTPPEFSKAVESEGEVSPVALLRTLELIEGNEVSVLVYNEQSGSPATEALLAAARKHGVPIVSVTETLPEGLDYQQWMTGIIGEVGAALDGASPDDSATPEPTEPGTAPNDTARNSTARNSEAGR